MVQESVVRNGALRASRLQASHILLVHQNPIEGFEEQFENWFTGQHLYDASNLHHIFSARHYRQHEIDITCGRHAPMPYSYLGLYELALDGAEESLSVIDQLTTLHQRSNTSCGAAFWIYFPIGSKVGKNCPAAPMLTVADANPVDGPEDEFREFYSTQHIRHALNIRALVSGQCFERSQFQHPGAEEVRFKVVALYEQVDGPEAIIAAFARLPKGTLDFPALNKMYGAFSECTYSLMS
jgi:hypothetical protein